jgi:DNA-formamidopyrimidine glycosylase
LEKDFNNTYFKKYIKNRNRLIKDILMDQKFVSGIGNIYANEILFLSKVRPNRKVIKLKDHEIRMIIKITKSVLQNSIKLGGSSIKNFSSSSGKKGLFQQYFTVYGKKMSLVLTEIVKIKLLDLQSLIVQLFIAQNAKNNKVDPLNLPIYTILKICLIQNLQSDV